MLSIRARAVRALIQRSARSTRELTLEERRRRIDRLASRVGPPRGTLVESLQAPGLRGEWVSVPRSREDRLVLYLHGGAFCMGSPLSHRGLVGLICRQAGARALSLDYALAPEHPFPAALDDTLGAWRYLRARGIPADRIVLAGDSAGANLVLVTLLMLRDAGEALPAAGVCLSPPTDFTGGGESVTSRAHLDLLVKLDSVVPLLRSYAGSLKVDDPRLSPLFADLSGLPPLLVMVGSHEILYDDSVRFVQKARESGVDARLVVGEKLWHVWPAAAPWVPEATRAVASIGRFIREQVPDRFPHGA